MKAEARSCDAQAHLGYMYENGLGVGQNYETALSWYQKSARRSSLGQFRLGSMYERGEGVPKSDTEAAVWYQKAANAGNTDAQRRLGKIYERRGEYGKAEEWYRKAKGIKGEWT